MSSLYYEAFIWQQIPAVMKTFLRCDRFRSVSLTHFQIDVASLMITEDGKFPLHRAEATNICHTRSLCPSIGRTLKYSDIDVPREMRLNVYIGFQFRIRMEVKRFPSFLGYWYTLWALLNLFPTQGFCVFVTGGKIHKHSASDYWAQSW